MTSLIPKDKNSALPCALSAWYEHDCCNGCPYECANNSIVKAIEHKARMEKYKEAVKLIGKDFPTLREIEDCREQLDKGAAQGLTPKNKSQRDTSYDK